MQVFQKIHCIKIHDVKKEGEKGNKFEHSHIFEKDVMPGQLYWFRHWAQSSEIGPVLDHSQLPTSAFQ